MNKQLTTAALIGVFAFAGCGGGDGESNQALSYDALGDAVGDICVETTSKITDSTEAAAEDPTKAVDSIKAGVAAIDEGLADTKALDPPEELQAAFDDYVAAVQVQRDAYADVLEAAEAGDAEAYQRAVGVFAKTDSLEAASKLGAESCLN